MATSGQLLARVWLCLALAGCARSGATDADAVADAPSDALDATVGDASTDADAQDAPLLDAPADLEVAADDVAGDVAGADVDSDSLGSDASAPDCEFATNPPLKAPGAPCVTGNDCDSGYCVDALDGKVCTEDCSKSCCPGGWECRNIATGTSPWYGCVPSLVHTCDPCTDDTQCQSQGDTAGLCLSYGDAGGFCGGTCVTDGDCPNSHYCLKGATGMKNGVPGTGGTGNQCTKKSGECACSSQAKATGLTTTCASQNKYGACSGTRTCQPSGLTACNAKTPTAEVCNGLDDNCDGVTDELGAALCTVFWNDSDKDGFGNSPATGGDNQCLCAPIGVYTSTTPSDCNDGSAAVSPTAAEICDGIDNNCNGKTDETCDLDKDGYCAADAVVVGLNKKCKYKGVDCDDSNPIIHPGQPEICGNSIDDDCDGATDSGTTDAVGCSLFYADEDGDAWGVGLGVCACAPYGIYTATLNVDCNDLNSKVFPGNNEICGNGIDDNCNGKQDEQGAANCTNFYKDADGDGYGDQKLKPSCLCAAPSATDVTTTSGDCNDNDPQVNPAMTEICNGVDEDCDGLTDNNNAIGCSIYYADYDMDGFGDSKKSQCLCAPVDVWTTSTGGDCLDNLCLIQGTGMTGAAINPAATEVCDGLDNDCDGVADNIGAKGCVKAFEDKDGDGFGEDAKGACVCGLAMPYNTFKGGDCDDTKVLIHPGNWEKCNGSDDNCNGATDEANAIDCSIYRVDADGDGFSSTTGEAACLCAATLAYPATRTNDCDDGDASINPGGTEVCNGKDDNCNGQTDERQQVCICGDAALSVCASVDPPGACSATACACDQTPTVGQACTTPVELGVVSDYDEVSRTVSGSLKPGDAVWLHFQALDLPELLGGCDPFSVAVWFSSNPDSSYRVDFYRDSCGATAELCSDVTATGWTVNFHGQPPSGPGTSNGGGTPGGSGESAPSPVPEQAGECPCMPNGAGLGYGYALPGVNFCTDNTADFFVRVRRKAAIDGDCAPFTLEIRNGEGAKTVWP